MKVSLGIIILLVAGAVSFVLWSPQNEGQFDQPTVSESVDKSAEMSSEIETEVDNGVYEIDLDNSIVFWAGQKPLINGYTNTGSLALSGGLIEVVDGDVDGELRINMDSLSVSETPVKPGSESALESHLKGERWFNVEAFPEASFEITSVNKTEGSMFDVVGNLTMKGQTHEVSFPAKLYLDSEGKARAEASFEIDRTKWGITAGSSSFFDNLADNAVSDMVAMSFDLVAVLQE